MKFLQCWGLSLGVTEVDLRFMFDTWGCSGSLARSEVLVVGLAVVVLGSSEGGGRGLLVGM